MGAKSTYKQEIADEICNRIAQGEPLRQICRDEHMPGWVTVYAWLKLHEQFAEHFARARELGYDAIAEEALEIANSPLVGVETEHDAEGRVLKTKKSDMLGHRKLQIETRLKLLAKWSPKKYGDKQQLEMSGTLDLGNMSVTELQAELAAITATGILNNEEGADDDIDDLI